MFRKTIFWLHLIAGVSAGLVVVMMSVTGILLTYERQMVAWSDRAYYQEPASGSQRQPLEALIAAAQVNQLEPAALTVYSDPSAPVVVEGGAGTHYMNPYSAEVLGEPEEGFRSFFDTMTGWHRWFNVSGEQRAPYRAATGISNIAFLFMICSGFYLWFPKIFRWPLFRSRLRFENSSGTTQQRDFNWHHVYGFWSVIPLFVVVATAIVFSYPWASALVYQSVGEPVPPRGMGMGMGIPLQGVAARPAAQPNSRIPSRLPVESLFTLATMQMDDWQSIEVQLPRKADTSLGFIIDQGDGGQAHKRHTLELNAKTGEIVRWAPFTSLSTGTQMRQWIRRLHTGEAYGLVGQTIAGIVSFTSLIMVWTGLALAYRRLILPLFRKQPG